LSVPDNQADPQARHPLRELGLVGGIVLLVVGGVAWWMSSSSTPAPAEASAYADYVGEKSCRECHPGESALFSRSGHARTLMPAGKSAAARKLDGVKVDDPERPGVTWSFALRDGRLTTERAEAGAIERFLIDYAFGSGHHATTFGTLTDRDPAHPVLFEHRLTAFAHDDLPGLTPGQSLAGHADGNTPSGRSHTIADTLKCFECHTTVTSDRGPLALDESKMIPNVSCERCHGPGRSHVEAARRGASGEATAMPRGEGRMSAAEELRFCGQCHRLPEMVTRGSIRPDNPVLVRHQPVGLMQSSCYLKSNGALGCITCHDPHARANPDRASYEPACLSCHQGPSRTPCPVSPGSGCIDCHMPRRDVARGMMLSDHWIRRRPPAAHAGAGRTP
jgi:hypothetical protein